MRGLLGFGVLLLSVSLAPAASTYYVDATGGDDANDGLSPAMAWQSVGQVASSVFEPGDSILFKRGEVWNEPSTIEPTYSGLETDPIVFGAYGNVADDRPIIRAALSSSEQGWTWTPSGAETDTYYLSAGGASPGLLDLGVGQPPDTVWRLFEEGTQDDIFRGTLGALADGEWDFGDQDALGFSTVYVRSDGGVPGPVFVPQTEAVFLCRGKNFFRFEDLVLEMAVGANIKVNSVNADFPSQGYTVERSSLGYGGASGFFMNGAEIPGFNLKVTLRESRFHHNVSQGVGITGFFKDFFEGGQLPIQNSGVLVENCEIDSNVGDSATTPFNLGNGFKGFYLDGTVFQGNMVHDNGNNGFVCDGSGYDTDEPANGLNNLGVGCDNSQIRDNVLFGNGASAIRFEHFCQNNDIHHNLAHENGFLATGADYVVSHGCRNNTIRFNVTYGSDDQGISVFIDSDLGSTGNLIVHNTLDRGPDSTSAHINLVNGKDIVIKNNMLISSPAGRVNLGNLQVQNAPPTAGFQQWDYNVWVFVNEFRWVPSVDPGMAVSWDLATYRTNTGAMNVCDGGACGMNTNFVPGPLSFQSPGPPSYDYTPTNTAETDFVGDTGLPAFVYAEGDFLKRPVNPLGPPRGAFVTVDDLGTTAGDVPTLAVELLSPTDLKIDWSMADCAGAADYAIYEGNLSALAGGTYDHAPLVCTDAGADRTEDVPVNAGDKYYLVVPSTALDEGSYGRDSAATERPTAAAACKALQTLGCQ